MIRGVFWWLFLAATTRVQGAIIKGTIKQSSGFEFIGKFCFDFTPQNVPHAGFLEGHVTTVPGEDPVKNGLSKLKVLFFDDEETNWDVILNHDQTCEQKVGMAKGHFDVNLKGEMMYHGSSWIAQHIRPRFWYVVLANCAGFRDVEYAVHFVNINRGATNREFGTNDQGLNWMYLCFGTAFTFLVIKHLSGLQGHITRNDSDGGGSRARAKLTDEGDVVEEEETQGLLGPSAAEEEDSTGKSKIRQARSLCCSCCNGTLHPIFKIFTAALIWAYFGILLMTIHTWNFAFSGIGYPSFITISNIALVVSRSCFLCLLMLLAKGWTISSNSITGATNMLITIGCFGLMNFLITMWESSLDLRAPNSSVPFFLSLLLHASEAAWLGFGVWFGITIKASHADEAKEAKQSLYIKLGALYLPWIVSIPILLILTQILNPWVRSKIMTGSTLSITCLAYMVMAYLLAPSNSADYFDVSVPDVATSGIDNYEDL